MSSSGCSPSVIDVIMALRCTVRRVAHIGLWEVWRGTILS